MEDGVGGVEDVPLGDLVVGVVGTKFGERPVGDVLAAVGAVFGVAVEREELTATLRHHVDKPIDGEYEERPVGPHLHPNSDILLL